MIIIKEKKREGVIRGENKMGREEEEIRREKITKRRRKGKPVNRSAKTSLGGEAHNELPVSKGSEGLLSISSITSHFHEEVVQTQQRRLVVLEHLLGLLKTGGGDQLHGLGNLLDRTDRLNTVLNLLKGGHVTLLVHQHGVRGIDGANHSSTVGNTSHHHPGAERQGHLQRRSSLSLCLFFFVKRSDVIIFRTSMGWFGGVLCRRASFEHLRDGFC